MIEWRRVREDDNIYALQLEVDGEAQWAMIVYKKDSTGIGNEGKIFAIYLPVLNVNVTYDTLEEAIADLERTYS